MGFYKLKLVSQVAINLFSWIWSIDHITCDYCHLNSTIMNYFLHFTEIFVLNKSLIYKIYIAYLYNKQMMRRTMLI